MKYFEKLKEHYDADLDNIKLARFEDEEGRQCIEKTFYEDIEVRILSQFFLLCTISLEIYLPPRIGGCIMLYISGFITRITNKPIIEPVGASLSFPKSSAISDEALPISCWFQWLVDSNPFPCFNIWLILSETCGFRLVMTWQYLAYYDPLFRPSRGGIKWSSGSISGTYRERRLRLQRTVSRRIC